MRSLTDFEDRLLADLLREHGAELAEIRRPVPSARRAAVSRPLWMVAAAAGMAGVITVGVTAMGGDTPAYAVTKDADGRVTGVAC